MRTIFYTIFFTCLFTFSCYSQSDMKLIYIGDPMCSWCYGFSPELEEIVTHYKGTLGLEIVMGGLRPYHNEPIANMKEFLSHHWEDVGKASGQPFAYGILDRADLNYDTEPPCRASVIVRHLDSDKELAFFQETQKAFYFKNRDMNQSATYHDILTNLGLDVEKFDKLFDSEEYKMAVKKDFERSRELGVSSFPTLLLDNGQDIVVVARGYAKSAAVVKNIDKLIKS